MCGILGVVGREPVDVDRFERMRDSMTHRGPDDVGLWRSPDGCVALGHRRLSIIDLSANGHQPMADPSGTLWVTFNGEIYNYQALRAELESKGHRFRSSSDTEVLLAGYRQWGTECVSRLNGMYAFGIFDTQAQRLFVARDRAGEKPLFYQRTPGGLRFASELKALMADPSSPRILDDESLEDYLAYGYVPGERCILRGFAKLPQGHALTYNLRKDELQVWSHWSLPAPARSTASVADLVDELEALLLESVRLRLIADVPVGIMLSGGIDSSLVTAMAARVSSRPVKTFNVSFPGHAAYDEAPHARLVAQHFGTDHVELAAEPAIVEELPALVRQFDEPLADPSMIPTFLVSQLIRKHATVALGGDGGDELFGGYPHYVWLKRHELVRRLIPGPVRRGLAAVAARLPPGVRGRNYVIGMRSGIAETIAHINMFFDRRTRDRLLRHRRRPLFVPEDHRMQQCPAGASALQQATSIDFRNYLVDDILVKVDRASMLASLEVRAPFLDPAIVDFAFGRVPDSHRAADGRLKILPKMLAAKLLPKSLDIERKQGFGVPLERWFRGQWGTLVEETLGRSEVFDRATVASLIAGQRRGLVNMSRIFALTVFELWRREYKVTG